MSRKTFEDFVLVTEAERITGISRQTIAKAVKEGRIDGVVIARRVFVRLNQKFWQWIKTGYSKSHAERAKKRFKKS